MGSKTIKERKIMMLLIRIKDKDSKPISQLLVKVKNEKIASDEFNSAVALKSIMPTGSELPSCDLSKAAMGLFKNSAKLKKINLGKIETALSFRKAIAKALTKANLEFATASTAEIEKAIDNFASCGSQEEVDNVFKLLHDTLMMDEKSSAAMNNGSLLILTISYSGSRNNLNKATYFRLQAVKNYRFTEFDKIMPKKDANLCKICLEANGIKY